MKNLNTLVVLLLMSPIALIAQTKEKGNLVYENIPEIPDTLRERMNQYQNARGATPSSWSPNGDAMLITTRFAETSQIHLIKMPLGARKQVTFFQEPVAGGSFCPNSKYNGFTFTKDVGGNEFRQLFWFDLNSGKYEMLSDGGRTQNTNVLWSEDGLRFIYVSTRRNKKDYDLYIAGMDAPKNATPILQKEGSWAPLDWSVDQKKLIVKNAISATRSYLHILDLSTGALQSVNPTDEEISYGTAAWTADGRGFFYTSDERSEYKTLRYYDVNAKKSVVITNDLKWDVDNLLINKARTTIVFAVNENGMQKLYRLNTSTKKYEALTGLPPALIFPVDFHPDDKTFSMVVNSPKTPSDVFTYDLEKNTLTQWTESEVGGIDNNLFVTPRLIEFDSFDKVGGKTRKIPAFYYRPNHVKGKIPVLIDIHGGPEAQSIPFFSAFRAFLTNELGIAVIEPNVRGSAGYGKSYLKLDNGYKREESVQDIGKLLDWIATQPDLDAERVAVTGGSYGGYMVLASMVHYNDRIRCGIDVVGISNFVTFLQNTEDYRKDLRRVEYGDERDPKMKEFLLSISPANHVDKITKPIFIIQGLNDPRVPASESEQMKDNLQEKKKEVWYLVAKDEGHGFRKKENIVFQQLAEVLFLKKYLLN